MKAVSRRISRWQKLVGVKHPIVQAPMAGVTTPKLVAAASENGALGTHAVAFLTPDKIKSDLDEIRRMTTKPFAVNLFAMPKVTINKDDGSLTEFLMSRESLRPYFEKYDLTPPEVTQVTTNMDYKEQLNAILCTPQNVKAISFTFGMLDSSDMEVIRSHGILVIGTATCVAEAIALEDCGVDAIIAQGIEAGGHRGTFIENGQVPQIGTIALVPQISNAVSLPVIASGGIMDGRGVSAGLVLGASAVQMGTAFLTCHESDAKEFHKNAVLSASDVDTTITNVFSGKYARGICNEFVKTTRGMNGTESYPIARYPIQQSLTNCIKAKAVEQEDTSTPSLWSGQAPTLASKQHVSELVHSIMQVVDELKQPDSE